MICLLLLLLLSGSASGLSNPHAVLGLQPGASATEIRRAYRTQALSWHPDKNSSPVAKEQWLRVQAAYEALTSTSITPGGADPFRPQQQQQRRDAWQRFWQQPRAPPRIHSETEDLDARAFYRVVLGAGSGDGGGDGGSTHQADSQPWLIQIYSHASPYCRVLSPHWEAAAKELGGLARLGRIDFEAQPLLVRYLASNLRLFSTHQPSRELPAVVGLPTGCTQLSCARIFSGHFTAAKLTAFAATHLLRLPPLPPLSPRLLQLWLRAAAAAVPGGTALLVLLPEGRQQPLDLLGAVAGAGGRLVAATAVWRPAERALWSEAVGATSAPALIFWRGGPASQPTAVVQGSLLTNRIAWAAEIERHTRQAVVHLQAPTAQQQHGPSACQLGEGAAVSASAEAPVCVLLLGRGVELALARAALEGLQGRLARSSSGWRSGSAGVRAAGQLLAGGRLQLAWVHAGEQRALCTHLVRYSGSSKAGGAGAGCLCAPWWRRLPAALLGQCGSSSKVLLLAYRQQRLTRSTSSRQLRVSSYAGSLADEQQLASWLAAVGGVDAQQQHSVLHPAPLPPSPLAAPSVATVASVWAARLALQALHMASQFEQMWCLVAQVAGGVLRLVDLRQAAGVALLGAALLGMKWLLDVLSGGDDALVGDGFTSPGKHQPGSLGGQHGRADAVSGRVREMVLSDWEASPGGYLVVLPLAAGGGQRDTAQAEQRQQQQRFASLAAVFQRERRLLFRVAPVSDTLAGLLAASAQPGNAEGAAASGHQQAAHQQAAQLQALILHPRRGGRFQLLPLDSVQQAVMRLEEVLDGGGRWCQDGPGPAFERH